MLAPRLPQQTGVQLVTGACEINLDHPVILPAPLPCSLDRFFGGLPRALPVRSPGKVRFALRLQCHLRSCLRHSVSHGGHISSTLHRNPNRLWDSSRLSIPITLCGGSAAKLFAYAVALRLTSSSGCRTVPALRWPRVGPITGIRHRQNRSTLNCHS